MWERASWRVWVVPALLVVVAVHQFYRVHAEGLSSWRGGGFGMYAGFHPRQHDLWVYVAGEQVPRRYTKYGGPGDAVFESLRDSITYRNADDCRDRVSELRAAGVEVERVDLWRLSYDPSGRTLGRELVFRVDAGGGDE